MKKGACPMLGEFNQIFSIFIPLSLKKQKDAYETVYYFVDKGPQGEYLGKLGMCIMSGSSSNSYFNLLLLIMTGRNNY